MGKPLREARMEAARAAAILRYSAGEAYRPAGEVYEPSVGNQTLYTRRRPLGVVGLITPWNFPVAIPVWKLAPALIYGNTVVLKLGYEAPRTGLHIAECFAEAGLPAGVLNVLTGAGSKVGRRARLEPGRAGDLVHGLGRRRPRGAERGDRPQLPRAARARRPQPAHRDGRRRARPRRRGGVRGRLLVGRPEVHRDPPDPRPGRPSTTRFREKLLARIAAAKVGDPADPETEVGPVVARGRVRRDPRGDRARQGRGRHGARGAASARRGLPHRADRVRGRRRRRLPLLRGGVRARHLALRFSTLDEALERANAVEFGLSAAIFTRDLHATQRFANELQAGILHVNSQTAGADVHVPFGGLKNSAWGPHEQGRAAMEFYTETVTVYQDAPLA